MDARSRSQTFTALAPSRPHFLARCATTMLGVVPLATGFGVLDYTTRTGFAHASAVGVACLVLSALQLLAMSIPTRATVGADGVLLQWLWQRTFIPIADILGVVPFQESFVLTAIAGLRIDRRSGPPVTVVVGTQGDGQRYAATNAATLMQRDVIEERIRDAMAQRDAHAAEPLRLPERGSRSPREWLEGLRKLAAPGGYRAEAAPEAPRLWELLEDPAQDAVEPRRPGRGRARSRASTTTGRSGCAWRRTRPRRRSCESRRRRLPEISDEAALVEAVAALD